MHFFAHCLFTQCGKIPPEFFRAFPELDLLFANTAASLLIPTAISKYIKHWIEYETLGHFTGQYIILVTDD